MASNKSSPASGGPTSQKDGRQPQQKQQRRKKKQHPENEFYDLSMDSAHDMCLNWSGHSESACTKRQGRGGPQWAASETEAGPSRLRGDGDGNGTAPGPAEDLPGPTSKFTPFRRIAYTFNFGDSDEEKDGGDADGGEGSKAEPGISKPPSPPPAPPSGTPPPPPLLLPEHVTMGDGNEEAAGQELPSLEDVDENADMTGIAVLDDSRSTGAIRYYDPRATDEFFANADLRSLCKRCKKPGHIERNCDVQIVCTAFDGANCSAYDAGCELAWRTYVYYPPDVRKEILKRKADAKGWKLEALGNNYLDMFCFNCAGEGHLGDDCRQSKGTKAPITAYPTAFSAAMARRGPYAASLPTGLPSAKHPAATHTRFDDNLPGVNPGFAGFGGAAAGRRGREKEVARQRELERRDDRDDWFSGRDNRRGGWTRQRSPEPYPAGGSRANRISGMGQGRRFGQVSAPTGRPGPIYRNDRDRGLRYRGDSAPEEGEWRRYRETEPEEGEWRASGAGGGPVERWGAEMDREDREARRARDDRMCDDRPRAGPSRRGGAGRGQRYTGGY
ncbi:uncharacterized protein CcaverHIS019_0601230 [Cutaneotrichosporon cavernicola]|uniref:CCHC-type domain-containing protein n=1 Tax=Cutaneotrichosporon cavernicola TaxID=279322 RepID=A0AA48L7Z0_9TREE|nr:uncharacterized protein CcaverHIS019_0601230 [Cutaneotrichosporon cavernicola]BEI93664.1 hypothetical protein CcaverHIS019_0601230 [Cutaneotrichosporon cavernicola]